MQIDQNEHATFEVVATGEGELSYQWMRNGARIPQANAPSLRVSRALLSDAGSYTCAVSNHCGITTTMAASLEVTARLNATVGEAGSAAGIIPGSDPPGGGNPPPPAIFFEVSGGRPGVTIESTVTAGASLGNLNGFFNEQALPRRADIRTHMEGGTYAILVVMGYSEADLDGIGEGALRLHVYDETGQTWTPAGSRFAGDGPPPVGPSADLVGTHGIDTASNRAWAVLDRDGAFAIGVPEPPGGTDPPGGGNPPPP